MGFLDNAGLAYLWGKVRTALGLKMDAATYDPTGKAQDVFEYVDGAVNGLPVKRLVGTTESPVNLDKLLTDGMYYISGIARSGSISQAGQEIRDYALELIGAGYPLYVIGQRGDGETMYGYQYVVAPRGTGISILVKSIGRNHSGNWRRCNFPSLSEDGKFSPNVLPNLYLPFSGGTLTGPLTLAEEPTQQMQAANKGYVDGMRAKAITVTLPAASWDATAKTQTVSVAGVLANETKQAITPAPESVSWEAAGQAGVRCTAQAAGKLTFTCSTVPTVDLTYNVLIQEVQV